MALFTLNAASFFCKKLIIALVPQGIDRQSDVNEESVMFGDIVQEDFHVSRT
jgi:hypothetical protein